MFGWLTGNTSLRRKAGELYGAVVAAARQPALYGPGRVADTPDGRFELVAVHLFLLAERLTKDGAESEKLVQALIEAFVTDMDDCMREMGVGDLKVPERVKHAAAVFYKRAKAYRDGLAAASVASDDARPPASVVVQAALDDIGSVPEAFYERLGSYMLALHAALARVPQSEILDRGFSFASLATFE